jgi:hypothetical protein
METDSLDYRIRSGRVLVALEGGEFSLAHREMIKPSKVLRFMDDVVDKIFPNPDPDDVVLEIAYMGSGFEQQFVLASEAFGCLDVKSLWKYLKPRKELELRSVVVESGPVRIFASSTNKYGDATTRLTVPFLYLLENQGLQELVNRFMWKEHKYSDVSSLKMVLDASHIMQQKHDLFCWVYDLASERMHKSHAGLPDCGVYK